MNNSQNVALTIKQLAKNRNVQIKKMLADCGLSINTLSTMQAGGSYPRMETIVKIAEYLDCSIDYLLGRTDEQQEVCGHSIKTGDVGDNSSHNDTSVKISDNQPEQLDETSKQLVNAFQKLDFIEKAKVMNLIAELINK